MRTYWIRCCDTLPKDEQSVHYYFEPFNKIYKGKFFLRDIDSPYSGNSFASANGFCDTYDAPLWTAKENPNPPTEEELKVLLK